MYIVPAILLFSDPIFVGGTECVGLDAATHKLMMSDCKQRLPSICNRFVLTGNLTQVGVLLLIEFSDFERL